MYLSICIYVYTSFQSVLRLDELLTVLSELFFQIFKIIFNGGYQHMKNNKNL